MTPFASNIINTPIPEALTPNQKRILFNVEKPLELSIEEFDKEWWPLVSNIYTGFSQKIMLMVTHGKFLFVDLINLKNQVPERREFHRRNVV